MNQITQVAIELSISRGTTTLTIIKAESHDNIDTQKPYPYMAKDLNVVLDQDKQGPGQRNLGFRIKELRLKRILLQARLAKAVGVNPSSISQVESNRIYPSLPTW